MPANHQPIRKKAKLDNTIGIEGVGVGVGAQSVVEGTSRSTTNAAVTAKETESDSKKRRKLKRTNKVKISDRSVTVTSKKRDFSTDLFEYLRSWSNRDHSDEVWKFNKVLQNWSLESCYDKGKVSTATFKLWLRYLPTIKGDGALNRIMSRANEILLVGNSAVGHEGGVSKSAVSRALKVKEVLTFVRSNSSNS